MGYRRCELFHLVFTSLAAQTCNIDGLAIIQQSSRSWIISCPSSTLLDQWPSPLSSTSQRLQHNHCTVMAGQGTTSEQGIPSSGLSGNNLGDRRPWQLRGGPTGSPQQVPRTPKNRFPDHCVTWPLPLGEHDISPKEPYQRLIPAPSPQTDSRDAAVFRDGVGQGSPNLHQDDEVEAAATEATQAIRRSLSTANEAVEKVLQRHRGQVTELEEQLNDAEVSKQHLRQKLEESALSAREDERRIRALNNDAAGERGTSEYLRARIHFFERRCRKTGDDNDDLRAEQNRPEAKLTNQALASAQATRPLSNAEKMSRQRTSK